jgi:hypothetical protein
VDGKRILWYVQAISARSLRCSIGL